MPIDGATASFRPTGHARYFAAAFLCVWLGGWAMGEAFAIYALVMLLRSMLGIQPMQGGEWLAGGAAAGGLLFILVWLAIWTFAGFAAISQMLRSLAGEDRIEIQGTAIGITRRAGPFTRNRSYERSDVRAIRQRPKDQAVMIDTATTSHEITTFGTTEERRQLVEWLQQRLAVASVPAPSVAAAPRGWMARSEDGATYLTRIDRRARWIGASVAWLVAATGVMSWVGAMATGSRVAAVAALGMTAVPAAVAAWLTFGVSEWLVRPGMIACRGRFLLWTRERTFQGARLAITVSNDSDGDRHYKLQVSDSQGSKTISHEMNDDGDTRELGRWMSARSGFPLT